MSLGLRHLSFIDFESEAGPRKTRYIYALAHVSNPAHYRYVGVTNAPKLRLSQHRRGWCRATADWMAALQQEGLTPTVVVLAKVLPHQKWQTVEKRWIRRMREKGMRLLNEDRGGINPVGREIWRKQLSSRGAQEASIRQKIVDLYGLDGDDLLSAIAAVAHVRGLYYAWFADGIDLRPFPPHDPPEAP